MRRNDSSTARNFDAMGTVLLVDRDPHSHHSFARQWFERDLDYVLGLDETDFSEFLQHAQLQPVAETR